MVSYIQLVVFGNFERFSTQNVADYIEFIHFWTGHSFQASSMNQMRVNADGLIETIIMPVFVKKTEASVEILGDRINFKLANVNGVESKEEFVKLYMADLYQNSMNFIEKFRIRGSRLALNCEEIIMNENLYLGENLISGCPDSERAERVLCRKEICEEMCNISRETVTAPNENRIRKFFDYNTLLENNTIRFSAEDDRKIFDGFFNILCSME